MVSIDSDAQVLDAAKQTIRHHFSGDGGFLSSLRPYAGTLDRQALADVLSAAKAILRLAERGAEVPISVISWLFGLSRTIRAWAIDDGGMLVRNDLITDADRETLRRWLERVEDMLEAILGTLEEREDLFNNPRQG